MSETKICSQCGISKPKTTEYFYKREVNKDGYYKRCKECMLAYDKEYREKQKKSLLEYRIEYKKTNKDIIKEKDKKRYIVNAVKNLKNKKKYYIENKSKISEYKKKYRQINLDKLRVINNQREAKKKLLPYNYTSAQWGHTKEYFDFKCAYCGKESNKLAQEHFIPLIKCGEYTKNNIVCACGSCNSSKNDKNFFDWFPEQPFYSKERELKILKFLNYDIKTKSQQLALII